MLNELPGTVPELVGAFRRRGAATTRSKCLETVQKGSLVLIPFARGTPTRARYSEVKRA